MKYWEEINDRLQMSEVVSRCGLQVNRAGFACCPFHNEKTPSMKIYDKSYYCFGCHSHGKAIDFIQKFYNLQFKDACRRLNTEFGLGLDALIDPVYNPLQKRMLAAKIESEKLKRQETERIQRIENGIILCSDIDKLYDFSLYETIVECSMGELLKRKDMLDIVDRNNYDYSQPNVIKRFKFDLVGTELFDNKVDEYMKKVHDLWKSSILNKQIREEEEDE